MFFFLSQLVAIDISFLNRLGSETEKARRKIFRQASLPVLQCFLALLW
jgi:hypothetical protein